MSRFRVKVCGITRVSDAAAAFEYGADMFGMIFYKGSERYIRADEAKRIVSGIPSTFARVGVFVNERTESILKLARQLRLDFVQLSGDESQRQIQVIQREGFKVIKAFRIGREEDYRPALRCKADVILLENVSDGGYGGSGATFDWSIDVPLELKSVMLAGGLNVDNIEEGVRRFQPLIVDVNSGVEVSPGIKSRRKLQEFLTKCDEIRSRM